MSAVGDIIAEVLGEHTPSSVDASSCSCGEWLRDLDTGRLPDEFDYRAHQADMVSRRLGVQERVEWASRVGAGPVNDSPAMASYIERHPTAKAAARRTVTTFEHVGEWEAVE